MTASEAIENLKKLKSYHNGSYGSSINMAIEALEKQEAGLIVELPVPIDGVCFRLIEGCSRISVTPMGNMSLDSILYGWGTMVFATREEAEKQLEELRDERCKGTY